MKALLSLALIIFVGLPTYAQSLEGFCERFNEPADVESPTPQQVRDYQNYSFIESIEKLYLGKRMRFQSPEELPKHQERVATLIKEITENFGYSVSTEQLLYCSNKNTANIDFNLLRFAVYHGLRSYFIF